MRLQGKVALVTGGNSGIGLAIAQEFQKEGATGAIVGRNSATLAAAAQKLGAGFMALRADVTRRADLEQVFEATAVRFGKLDVLVVNAGGVVGSGSMGSVAHVSESDYDQMMGLNLKSVFFTVQQALPYLRDGAAIVLVSSSDATRPTPGTAVYSAAKAGINSFARSFSQDLLERRIRVNVVSPGPVETPILTRLGLPADALAQVRERRAGLTPLKRVGTAREVAQAAVFLASADSSFLLGSEVLVDGGLLNV